MGSAESAAGPDRALCKYKAGQARYTHKPIADRHPDTGCFCLLDMYSVDGREDAGDLTKPPGQKDPVPVVLCWLFPAEEPIPERQ